MTFRLCVAFIWLIGAVSPVQGQTCRQALVLGLDVSLSVNLYDFTLQREGLASALVDDEVVSAMVDPDGSHVELAVFEWSGQHEQYLLVDWTVIDSPAKLAEIATQLIETPREMKSGRTGLGAAMLYARDLLESRSHCLTRTVDLSGDGQNNSGPQPEQAKAWLGNSDLTVNGLVIGVASDDFRSGDTDIVELSRYYQDRVIMGALSFVETVIGFENYAEAMKRKLLRELVPALVWNSRPEKPVRF